MKVKQIEVYRVESFTSDKTSYYKIDDKTGKAKRISENEWYFLQAKAKHVCCIYSVYNGNKNIKHYRTLVL